MKKTIRLFDYKNNEKTFVINDFEKVKVCIFQILSGDGVLELVYQDGKSKTLDSGTDRLIGFDDGLWVLEPKDIDVINDMKYYDDTDKLDEVEDGYDNKFNDHYVITVDFGNRTEELHIELEIGKQLLNEGGIKL